MQRINLYLKKFCLALKNRPLPGTAALLLLTGAIHLWAFTWAPCMTRDSIQYVSAAARWAENGRYDLLYFPPLPCFLMKLLIQLGLPPEFAGRTCSFTVGLLLPFAAYHLAVKATGNRRLARYTAIMAAVHPMLLFFSVEPLRDGPFILFSLLALTAGISGLKKQTFTPWFICSLFTAAAWGCRFEALEITMLAFIALLVCTLKKQYSLFNAAGHFTLYFLLTVLFWIFITLGTGGPECFTYQYDNYILNKWNLLVERWKV